jgi:hypothetical protein
MKNDCRWFNSNLEAYFLETLQEEQKRSAMDHLKSCPACSEQVLALQNVDPIIKQLFQYRLTLAQTRTHHGQRLRVWRLALAGTTVALATLVGLALLFRTAPSPTETVNQSSAQESSQGADVPEKKDLEAIPIQRAKPDGISRPAAVLPEPDMPISDGPDFAVIDAAGYPATLEDYRGYVLLLGIWSPNQPETAESLNRVYETFGRNPQVKVVGVASQRQDKPGTTTFPVVYNHGSRLMGLKTGEFVLLDKTGDRRFTESLTDNAKLMARIKSELDQMGAK